MNAGQKRLSGILSPGVRSGLEIGVVLAAVDFPFSLSKLNAVTCFKATMSALYLSCLTIVLSSALGALAEQWLKAVCKFNRLVRPGSNAWFQAVSLGLPAVVFALWVPSEWIGQNWADLSNARRFGAVAALALIVLIFAALSRGALEVVRIYRTDPRPPRFHWPLFVLSAAVGIASCFADRNILAGLYENFHWGLAGAALAGFSIMVLLAKKTLESRRLSDRHGRLRDISVAAIALSSVGVLTGAELADAHVPKLGPTVFFDRTIRILRKATDFDNDGSSSMFGGADCDNFDSSVSPGRFDFPENRIDENCSGRDARWPEVTAQSGGIAPDRSGYNLLLITVEALRADRLGSFGYRRNTTPNIDRIASKSLVFRRAYCQSNLTFYTVPSMMAGRYLSNLSKSWDHPKLNPKKLVFHVTEDTRLFAEVLAKAGYSNAAFSIPQRVKWQGMNRGFKVFSSGDNYLGEAKGFLKSAAAPFFIWMHPWQAHSPYVKNEKFDFGDSDSDRYDSELAFVDSQIGQLIKDLKRLGEFDRTIIVITSDHGEEFGEHGGRFHGRTLFDELTHVPLIVKIPGIEHAVLDISAELVDLVPTLLDLLRLKDESLKPDGKNLFAAMKSPSEDENSATYAEYFFFPEREWMKSLRTKRWKLISDLRSDSLALYDLESDPGETTDVSYLYENVVSDLTERMEFRPLGHQGALFREAGNEDGLVRLAQGLIYIQQEALLLEALDLLKRAEPAQIAPHLKYLSRRYGLPESVANALKAMGY